MNSVWRRATPDAWILLLYLSIGLVAFRSILPNYFLSDDFVLIGDVATHGVASTWLQHLGFFRPIWFLGLWLNWWLWGFEPLGYHLFNVGLHVINAFLVLRIGRDLLKAFDCTSGTTGLWPVIAGLLFLLSPTHVESVVWIAGVVDVLATTFALLSVAGFLRYLEHASSGALAFCLVSLSAALLTKESTVATPGV